MLLKLALAIPLHLILALAYTVMKVTIGVGWLYERAFQWTLPSEVTLTMTHGDCYVVVIIAALMIELIKSVETGWASIGNHIISTLAFISAFAVFLTTPDYTTKVFGVLTVCLFVDVVAGFVITTASARRDFSVG